MGKVQIMNIRNDPEYLRKYQYKNSENLDSRIKLHSEYSTNKSGWSNFVRSLLKKQPGNSILEVGCGPARGWSEFIRENDGQKLVCLSDFSFGMVRSASRFFQKSGRILFGNIDVQFLPFADNSFDIAIANHMLYHVPDIEQALSEISRVLSPSGVLVTATNGVNHMKELREFVHFATPNLQEVYNISSNFSLENGASYLEKYFNSVELHIYPDSLEINDANPILDYILSIWGNFISNTQLESIKKELKVIISKDKVFKIQKSSGLFLSQSKKDRN